MYAKVFRQILDSSIAEDYEVRHVFEDLLKLATVDGVIDMTVQAIARTTNVPLEIVEKGIRELERPDPESRTTDFEGRRIILLEPNKRSWGWMIVNYQKYRDIQDEEARRAAFREAKRKQREKEAAKKAAKIKNTLPYVNPDSIDEEPQSPPSI
jgi:hypothetical protein